MDKKLNGVQTSGFSEDVVRYIEEVSACGAADAKLDSAIVISFLFNYWIVLNDFVVCSSVFRYQGMWDGKYSAG